jgi:O-antigen/teichoic acid export membrane protein
MPSSEKISNTMMQRMRSRIFNILRWSEKYTRTDMVYLAKGGSWLSLGKGIAMLSTFVLSILFANLLPKETYGIYKYILSAVGILSIATLSGMGTSITRAIARGFEGTFKPAIYAEMKWGIIGGVSGLAVSAYYWVQGAYVLAVTFGIVGIFLPFINVFNLYGAILSGKKRFDLMVRFEIYTQLINFGLMVPVLLFVKDVYLLILPFLLVNSVVQGVLLKWTVKKVPLNNKIDPEAISYGKHLTLMDLVSVIATMSDKLLIYHLLGPVQLAIYAIALAPTDQIKGLLKIIGQLAFPKFSEQSKEVLEKVIFKKVIIFTLAISPLVAAYVIAAPWLFKIFFPAYMSSVIYSQVFCVSLMFSGSMLLMQYLQSQSMKAELYKFNFINLIIEIILIVVLVYFFGLWGAIAARVGFRFLNLMTLIVLSRPKKNVAIC